MDKELIKDNISKYLQNKLEDWTGSDISIDFCNNMADELLKLIFES